MRWGSLLAPTAIAAAMLCGGHSLAFGEEATAAAEHPLAAELKTARERLAKMEENVKSYTCKLTKRERVGGELRDHEIMFARIRHEPFSVYMYFLSPEGLKGQQAAYVHEGEGTKLKALPVGVAGRLGIYSLDPTGFLAMQGQRYPITEIGMLNLGRRLIEVGEQEMKNPDTVVKKYYGAKIAGRPCTVTEVINPNKGEGLQYHKARIFIDDELDLPVRFESYDWPDEAGGEPLLLEEYTYTDIKLNPGLDDSHFEIQQ